jgi:hypothetical protein
VSEPLSAKLSKDQRAILRALLRYVEWAESRGWRSSRGFDRIAVPMRWLRPRGAAYSRAASACFSRSLLRLEGRGLILRSNTTSGVPSGPEAMRVRTRADQPLGRTECILLADEGREVAKRLTLDNSQC